MLHRQFATTCHPQFLRRELQVSESERGSQLQWRTVTVSFLMKTLISILGSPPPGQYPLVSDFDIGNPKKGLSVKKGHLYSFGAPHSIYRKVYNPENPQSRTEGMPGPGTYNDKTLSVGYGGLKYKF